MAPVELTSDGGVMTITLNRPDVLNAFDAAMHEAFGSALREARRADVRAVVLTGAGRGFSVGQDLRELSGDTGDVAARLRRSYHPNVLALRALEKPVIAAVNGPAAGAGLSLACACDIRVASDEAVFVPAFVNIGLIPDSGGSFFVSRILGSAQTYIESVDGKLHGFWYAFGEHDAYTLWEAPDNVSMAAVALAITGGGALSSLETTVLLTVDETIEALRKAKQVQYRAPGA